MNAQAVAIAVCPNEAFFVGRHECKDSILAAPLAIEIARCLDLAKRRNEKGVLEEISIFFKMPMTRKKDAKPENALHRQEDILLNWLEN